VTAEVEFESEAAAEAFTPPPWLGRDVTDEPGYKNQRLAVHGLPSA
jgi:adenylate cyclase